MYGNEVSPFVFLMGNNSFMLASARILEEPVTTNNNNNSKKSKILKCFQSDKSKIQG